LRLGVIGTPIREALIRFTDEGIVDNIPQRGTFVAPILVDEEIEA
jgi:DNA-binding GntR family transcriptional regulator|tara:strand:+ start:452 stop:586 length:135 start_codon:yes stop_codon:yes gene_type:complete